MLFIYPALCQDPKVHLETEQFNSHNDPVQWCWLFPLFEDKAEASSSCPDTETISAEIRIQVSFCFKPQYDADSPTS